MRNPKIVLLATVAIFTLGIAAMMWKLRDPWPPDSPVLRMGFQQSPPYQILGPNNEPGGIANDIIMQAAENLGMKLEWVYSPKSPDYHFEHGDVDLWPVVTDIPYRRKNYHITKPIYQNSLGMLTLQSSEIQKPKDTARKTVAFYNREPGISLVKKLFPEADYVPMPGNVETIQSVFQHKADAAFLWSTKANSVAFKQAVDQYAPTPFKFYLFHNTNITCGLAGSYQTPNAVRAADLLRKEIRKLATNGMVSEVYFKYYLDPENEISSYFQIYNLQQRNLLLTICISVAVIALLLLIQMAIQLNKSQKIADAANESKSAFLANMSHEIRTPLNGAISMTELALSTDLTDNQRFLIKTAYESSETLLSIVNDILDFSQIEARKLNIEFLPLNIKELVESSITFFKVKANEKEIDLTCEKLPDCPDFVMGDSIRLRQILFNLIGNAVKYTKYGNIAVVTRTETEDPYDQKLVIEVKDTGVGIPSEKQKTIFEPFEQADISNKRKYGGTGLGLAICKHLVELMNGVIELDSIEGIGSTFRIKLPLKIAKPIKPEPAEQTALPEDTTWKILLVDDNPINLKIAQKVLERHNHTVFTANDGKQASDRVKTDHFDLVLMDLQMPVMDGYEATKEIREWEKENSCYTPIVALTACVLNNEELRCKNAGMDGYLSKPLKVKSLIDAVNKFASQKTRIPTS